MFLIAAPRAALAFASVSEVESQHEASHTPEPAEHEHAHSADFEASLSPGVAFLTSESEFAFAMHLHLLHALGGSAWAAGVGFERIFDEHAHNALGALVEYRPFDAWAVAIGPGVAFSDDWDHVDPTLHLETVYEWFVGDMHLGPGLEVAVEPHEVHLSLGLHFAIGF
jgi:hypothetical protein